LRAVDRDVVVEVEEVLLVRLRLAERLLSPEHRARVEADKSARATMQHADADVQRRADPQDARADEAIAARARDTCSLRTGENSKLHALQLSRACVEACTSAYLPVLMAMRDFFPLMPRAYTPYIVVIDVPGAATQREGAKMRARAGRVRESVSRKR
jgi:hypothetical protein